ncbi:peptidyl-tRNA hydrolase [Edhazardia aedis USNM 41457]|uniref:peptidyl-tRNA hydrolase n=1 Tax=Edhazardia aedis (strain USNM 41457) TaxID=1003232 RepID=J9DA76_EDHAE|nr:peptidyl-tRNA hydrolase [Edhazardia aedis USNM 41457]|eukprot:EJW04631.1 peptidyl-tRNA hydrolase [Edhazardia aedis USNM 41457]
MLNKIIPPMTWQILAMFIVIFIINIIIWLFYKRKLEKKSALASHRLKKEKKLKFDSTYQLVLQIVVRVDLKMGKGKIAAQVGHAVSKVIDFLIENPEIWEEWKAAGEPKVILKASDEEINNVLSRAKRCNVKIHKVYDAGRTQVKAGSNTVIALGPAPKDILSMLTGDLKLL